MLEVLYRRRSLRIIPGASVLANLHFNVLYYLALFRVVYPLAQPFRLYSRPYHCTLYYYALYPRRPFLLVRCPLFDTYSLLAFYTLRPFFGPRVHSYLSLASHLSRLPAVYPVVVYALLLERSYL